MDGLGGSPLPTVSSAPDLDGPVGGAPKKRRETRKRICRFLESQGLRCDTQINQAAETLGLGDAPSRAGQALLSLEIPQWFQLSSHSERERDLAFGAVLLALRQELKRLSSGEDRLEGRAFLEGFRSVYRQYFDDLRHPFWELSQALISKSNEASQWFTQNRSRRQAAYTASDLSRRGEEFLFTAVCPAALCYLQGRPGMAVAIEDMVLALGCGLQLLVDQRHVERDVQERRYTPVVVDLLLEDPLLEVEGFHPTNGVAEALAKNLFRAQLYLCQAETLCEEMSLSQGLASIRNLLIQVGEQLLKLSSQPSHTDSKPRRA